LPVFRELLRHLRGPVIVVPDNSSTHHGKPLQQLDHNILACTSSTFPPMLPSSTPMRRFGHWRNRALANSCSNDWEELIEDEVTSSDSFDQLLRAALLVALLQRHLTVFAPSDSYGLIGASRLCSFSGS
jgi:hypothetical protein